MARVFCLLPPERIALASVVQASGAVAVVDLGLAGAEAPAVPVGVWVRVRSTAGSVPGTAGVIAAEGPAITGRACWRETCVAEAPPTGWDGVVLRGSASGGHHGELPVGELLPRLPAGVRALVDHQGADLSVAGAEGLVLSDTLFLLMDPPAGLAERARRAVAADLRSVGGVRVLASPAAPVVQALAAGAPLDALARGVIATDDAFTHAWPVGVGILHARSVADRFGTFAAALAAFVAAASAAEEPRSGVSSLAPPTGVAHEMGEVGTESGSAPIAVIGLGCRLPGGASSAEGLWTRILAGFDAIGEVPAQRWDPALFWNPDPHAPDRTYAKIGAFISDDMFNPRRFRIPPAGVAAIDPLQRWALDASADAMEDAGYGTGSAKPLDRSRVAVILGNSMGGEIGDDYNLRVALPALRAAMDATPDFAHLPTEQRVAILESWEARVKAKLPPITEDSMPGELSNVVAGRVANALDLGGPNFTTDAACASSMAALQAAVKGLQDGDFDLALTGGADRTMGVATYVKFCKIGALSPDGSRPFDAGANGFVMGEGCGVLVVKRLADAERDGDRIYAVIRGIGASSDGRGKGITAPNPVGQLRALTRAYESAGLDPADVDLFECHGTSTVVGDKVEVEALSQIIGARGSARGPARIGSIKSNLGHLKSAAGAASALKAVLAVHHGVLAPQINYRNPRPDLDLDRVPLRVQTAPEAWENPRRIAGVSSFGFGGTNFHLVVEGWRPGMDRGRSARRHDSGASGTVVESLRQRNASARGAALDEPLRQRNAPVERSASSTDLVDQHGRAVGPQAREARLGDGERAGPLPPQENVASNSVPARTSAAFVPPAGIWALSADTPEELIARCRALARGQAASPFEPDAAFRVAAAAANEIERNEQLERVIATVQKGKGHELLRQRGIAYEDVPCDGHLAFLFTGQGSQYVGMGLELAAHFPVVADTFREADEVMTPLLGRPLTDYLRRDPAQTEDAQFEALRQTEISQPATLAVDVAILRLLAAYGVRPDMVAGHSLGEYGAAVAAGMLSFRDALQAVSARGREMAAVQIDDKGRMAGIATSAETVAEVLAEIPGYVVAANKNCPTQTVIAGETEAVEAACEAFRSRGITVYPLPVSHAFHSRIVAPASAPLRKVLAGLDLRAPQRRITTNVDSRWYPTGPDAREAVLDILARQVASPVEWIDQMERMYGEGARIFVECGPKRALAGFTTAIFKHRPHRSLYTNQPKRGDVQSFLDALAALLALGFPVEARTSPGADRAVDLFAESAARRSTTPLLKARAEARANALAQPLPSVETRGTPAIEREIRAVVAQKTGWTPDTLDLDFDLESDLGIDTVKLADIVATVRERLQLPPDPDFRMGDHRTLRSLIDYAGARIGATRPSVLSERRPVHERATPTASTPILDGDVAARFLAEIAGKDLRGLDAGAFAAAMLPALQGFLSAAHAAWSAAQPRDVRTTVARDLEARSALLPASSSDSGGGALPRNAPPGGVTPWTPGPSVGAPRLRIACSGASLGLPGGEEVFSPDNLTRILRGENRIGHVGAAMVAAQLAQNVVRVTKDASSGQGDFARVETPDQAIRLAGRKAAFDPAAWGMDEDLVRSLDITTQLAIAAGYEALRDAGLPLVRTYRTTTSGKSVATGWALPEGLRDDTGIILASAFPGYDQLLGHLARAQDPESVFDRRFLFQVLAMGHAQFAQLIGARGPNTGINAACASTTQALALAEDWIRLGRARRVIVLGADDVTNDRLFPWIGTGFLAAGAASTKDRVEDAALPFDRRRHGMIAGMGAVALVLEPLVDVEARGMAPVAELLGTRIANSAFHGTRLDAAHIAAHVASFVGEACAAAGVDRATFARRALFMSHETYTPARGGSAAAEMASLPAAFGDAARHVRIANTKGFTGHAMGAGIEDAVAVKALQYRTVPPIANLLEPDPDLGELHLSEGGPADIDFALRLAAGFGSQLALAAWRRAASGDTRVVAEGMYQGWLATACGGAGHLEVAARQLRYITGDGGPVDVSRVGLTQPSLAPFVQAVVSDSLYVLPPISSQSVSPTPARVDARDDVSSDVSGFGVDVLAVLLAVIAAKTGYGVDELDPSFALEADLGIDTVKQAEIFGEVRERFSLPRDDSFRLADYPTIEALAGWLQGQVGGVPEEGLAQRHRGTEERQDLAAAGTAAVAPRASAPVVAEGDVLAVLLAVIAAKTGYGVDELDPSFALEADLGIDTVKQAEIFGEVRERFSLPREDSFRLADHPTILSLAGWLEVQVARAAGGGVGHVGPDVTPRHGDPGEGHVQERAPAEAISPAVPEPAVAGASAAVVDVAVVAETDASPADVVEESVDESVTASNEGVRGTSSADQDATDGDVAVFHVEQRVTAPWIAPDALAAATAAPAPELVAASAMLPASFRMRGVVWVNRTPSPWPSIDGQTVKVLGDGPLADALRGLLATLGADRGEHPDVVVDCGAPVLDAFGVAKALDAHPPSQWLSVEHGEVAGARDARDAGARAGLAKALGREWGECRARVVALDAALDAATAAEVVLRELSEVDEAAEVRLGADRREVAVLATRSFPDAGRLNAAGGRAPVVLLTGGTRGITARVAQALAEAGPCTLVLVGRTGPGLAPLDEAAAKRQARTRLEAAGERVVPRRIEEILAPLRVAEEVRRTVAALRAVGATVEIQTVDMADEGAVQALVAQVVRQHGHLDLCVHGAGVEESRLLSDKDAQAFHRVYDAKAVGGLALAEALPSTALFVSMGSIAGRLGNAGQVDYAAANEAMARVCRARPRSLHVAWTAWGDTGMAVRGGMEALLTGRGVDLLPAAAGAALVRDMVAAMDTGALSGEVLVAGALGDFTLPPLHALADVLELDGDTAVLRRELSLDTDPWLGDHAIGGVPVLPGVIGLELMVAAALAANPEGTYCGVEDVRFEAPLKLHRDAPVHIEVRATPEGDGSVRCVLRSRRRARTGRELETDHFSARVQLDGMPLLPRIRPAVLPEEILAQRDIYLRFFHGPRFQVLEGVEAIGLDGLLGQASVSHAPIAEGLLSDPLVLEAAFQAAGLHRMVVEGILALPASIDAVERVRPVVDGDLLTVTVQRREGAYDIDVDADDGRVMTVRGFRLSDLGPLPERDRFPEPEGGRGVDPVGGLVQGEEGLTQGHRDTEQRGTSATIETNALARGASHPVTATATATEALTELPADEVAWLTARGTPTRQADRLAGQLAARRAVEKLAGGRAFTVSRLPSGAPVVEGLGDDVHVSISHQEGRAIAMAARGGAGLGVDLETIAARDPAFARTWFTEEEQARWGGDPANATRVWALKEAALKALGHGMARSPRDVEVCELGGSGGGVAEEGGPSSAPSSTRSRNARLHLHGEVACDLAALGNPRLHAEVADLDDVRVLATVVLAA